jgi:CheY-like chemotaxis protein
MVPHPPNPPPLGPRGAFLVVDEHRDSCFLFEATLRRMFPSVMVLTSTASADAIDIARTVHPVAIVVHRTFDMTGPELVRAMRIAAPQARVVMVSSVDRRNEAMEAGASAFLLADEWLRLGKLLEELIFPTKYQVTPGSELLPPASAAEDGDSPPKSTSCGDC